MLIESVKYNDEYSYLKYTDGKLVYTNAEYFIIDTSTKRYKSIVKDFVVGSMLPDGLRDEDVKYIMLYALPQEYNDFVFLYVYLDENKIVLETQRGINFASYNYHKFTFKDCIVDSGFIYELDYIKQDFCHNPSIEYSFAIDGRHIKLGDKVKCTNISFLDSVRQDNLRKAGFDYYIAELYENFIGIACFNCTFINKDGDVIIGTRLYPGSEQYNIAIFKGYNNNTLNKMTVQYVSAHGQFMALELIKDMLTEEEVGFAKRGQNASKASVAKHASVAEYRASTGFECLLGYLELTGQRERIEHIIGFILENLKFE